MNAVDRLSPRQLYVLHENRRAYDRQLRAAIETAWQQSGLQIADFPQTEAEREQTADRVAPLPWQWRLLVILLPFPSPLHPLIAAQLMDHGLVQMCKDFYRFRAWGFGIWFGVVLLLGTRFPFWFIFFLTAG